MICCQVLEHVWNLSNATKNLSRLVRQGGYIWLNVPASNMKHGSPKYYSAGYQSEMFEKLFGLEGFQKISNGEIGTKRLYCMTHKQQYWPSSKVLKNPFLRGIESHKLLFPLKFIKYFLSSVEAITWSNKIDLNSKYATEAYFFGKKL